MSRPIALYLDAQRNGFIEREETRQQFESDPLTLGFIAEYLMRDVLPNIRRNYSITDLVKREDGQYVLTFTRKSQPTSAGRGD